MDLPTLVILGLLTLLPLYLLVSRRIQAKNNQNARLRNVEYRPMAHEMWQMLSGSRVELEEQKHLQKYGPIFAYKLFGSLTIMVAEPEIVQLVLSKEFTSFINRRVSQSLLFSLLIDFFSSRNLIRMTRFLATFC